MSNSRNSVSSGILSVNAAWLRIKQSSHGFWKTWKVLDFPGLQSPGTKLLAQEGFGNMLNSREMKTFFVEKMSSLQGQLD